MITFLIIGFIDTTYQVLYFYVLFENNDIQSSEGSQDSEILFGIFACMFNSVGL